MSFLAIVRSGTSLDVTRDPHIDSTCIYEILLCMLTHVTCAVPQIGISSFTEEFQFDLVSSHVTGHRFLKVEFSGPISSCF